jgi:hypothetical protein
MVGENSACEMSSAKDRKHFGTSEQLGKIFFDLAFMYNMFRKCLEFQFHYRLTSEDVTSGA